MRRAAPQAQSGRALPPHVLAVRVDLVGHVREHHVLSVAAADPVEAAADGVDAVVAGTALDRVVVEVAVDDVIAVLAVDDVVAAVAGDGVVARAAEDEVAAVAAMDLVVAVAAAQGVVAVDAVDVVVAVLAEERVVAVLAEERVVAGRADEDVVAGCAGDVARGARRVAGRLGRDRYHLLAALQVVARGGGVLDVDGVAARTAVDVVDAVVGRADLVVAGAAEDLVL